MPTQAGFLASRVFTVACCIAFLLCLVPAQDAVATRAVADRLAAAARQFDRVSAGARKELLDALARAQNAAKDPALKQRHEEDRIAFETDQLLPASIPTEARSFERALLRSAVALEAAHVDAAARYRALGDTDAAERIDSELAALRSRHEALRECDLRAQVNLASATRAGTWAWKSAAIVNASESAAALRLPPPEAAGFPSAYRLTLEVARLEGSGELHVAFPRVDAGKRSLGLLTVGTGSARLAVAEDGDVGRDRTSYAHKAIFAGTAPLTFTIVVDAAGMTIQLGGSKILAADAATAMVIPEELRPAFAEATTAHVAVAQGSIFRIRRIVYVTPVEPKRDTQASDAATAPGQPLPDNSEWKGTWDGSGVQDGDCRSIEVIARDGATATLAVTTNRGAVFHFFLEIKGKSIRVTDMIHRKSAGREVLALSDVHGSGSVTKDGFSFSFTARRAQAKRRDNWQGTIKATRAK